MQIFFAELSEQSAITLTTSLFSASVTVLLGVVVFAATQYLSWRLETTKHLRQKLEELLAEVLTADTLLQPEIGGRQSDIWPMEHAGTITSVRVKMGTLQKVYFPSLVIYVGDIINQLGEYCEALLDLDEEAYRKEDGRRERFRQAIQKVMVANTKFFESVAADMDNLTKKPFWFKDSQGAS